MPTALIVGASRGIGLEFSHQYLADDWRVFGTFRTEADRIRLRDLGVQTLKLDVLDPNDLAAFGWQMDGERVDALIMNAGVYGPRTSSTQRPPTLEEFDQVMRTNVLSAMRLLPMVAPMLSPGRGTMAFVSSRMGSIAGASASYGLRTSTWRRSACGSSSCIPVGCAPTWAGRTPRSTWRAASPGCAR
jgi:NAD(P)-dependent dehydrogenase (short-subunit alcohol dehydrogenase family)